MTQSNRRRLLAWAFIVGSSLLLLPLLSILPVFFAYSLALAESAQYVLLTTLIAAQPVMTMAGLLIAAVSFLIFKTEWLWWLCQTLALLVAIPTFLAFILLLLMIFQ